VEIKVRVNPRASRRRFRGVEGGTLRFDLNSPPLRGEANRELVEMVSDLLGVSRSRIKITGGERGREKRLLVEGMDGATLKKTLRLEG